MELKKNYYYDALIDGRESELAVRSDFKGDFNATDYCICQIRDRSGDVCVTRYKLFTASELRKALMLSPRTKIEIGG
jgi:hypothetical protein